MRRAAYRVHRSTWSAATAPREPFRRAGRVHGRRGRRTGEPVALASGAAGTAARDVPLMRPVRARVSSARLATSVARGRVGLQDGPSGALSGRRPGDAAGVSRETVAAVVAASRRASRDRAASVSASAAVAWRCCALVAAVAAVAAVAGACGVAGAGPASSRCRDGRMCRRRDISAAHAAVVRIAAARAATSSPRARRTGRRTAGRTWSGPGAGRSRSTCRRRRAATRSEEIAQVVVDDRDRAGARDVDGPAGRLDHGARDPGAVRPRGRTRRGSGSGSARSSSRRSSAGRCACSTWISRCSLAFSVSYAFFGAGEPRGVGAVGLSAARVSARPHAVAGVPAAAAPPSPSGSPCPAGSCCSGSCSWSGSGSSLNVTNGNVIDVGYAGVIGADRLLHGDALYGGFPADNAAGDTYGPLAYLAYVPVRAARGRGAAPGMTCPPRTPPPSRSTSRASPGCGSPAARLGGRRWRCCSPTSGLACPFTLLVANSGANDALVAALVLAAFLCLGRPAARGALAVAAGLTKFAPLALVPLFVALPARRACAARWRPSRRGRGRARPRGARAGGLERFWDRTLGFQADRASPFSIWGLYGGLDWLQAALTVGGRGAGRRRRVLPAPARRDHASRRWARRC